MVYDGNRETWVRGYLLLSEARSGSNWLGTLANNTGTMGHLEEWLLPHVLGIDPRRLSWQDLQDTVFKKAATPNNRFAIKIFSDQLVKTQRHFGLDFIAETCRSHETTLIFLHRRDRIGQAISLAKAHATQQWRSVQPASGIAKYDFERIFKYFVRIEKGYSFWKSYLPLCGVLYDEFVYEDLLAGQSAYLDNLAGKLAVTIPAPPTTTLRVQRDETTDEWTKRFRADLAHRNIVALVSEPDRPKRTIGNLCRFLKRKPMR